MLGNKTEYDKMDEAEGMHWWYYSLHNRVLNILQKHFKTSDEIKIVDAGCGTGGLMLFLQKSGFSHLEGFDISDFAESACRRKNLPFFKASLTEISLHYSSQSKDVVICCDALYFLDFETQKKVVADFINLIKPGGILILNLPSLEVFKGTHDLSVGIGRRYNHENLEELIPESVEYSYTYWPVLLSPVIAIARTLQRKKIRSGEFKIESDIHLPPYIINELIKRMMKLEMKIFPRVKFGSSLFVVVKKKF